ncbi:MAG: tetratricopeptide repeat protein [Bacillota bacterium]
MDLQRLGETVKALRKRRGLTQSQLAGEELTKGYISQIEHGRIAPSIRTLGLLASRLGCSLADLMGPGLATDVLDEAENAFLEGDLNGAWTRLEQLAGARELIPRYLVLAADIGARLGKDRTPELISLAMEEGSLSNTDRARVYNAWGLYLAAQGNADEALERFEKARELLENGTADIPLKLRVLSNCGNFQLRAGRQREALARFQESLDLSRRAGVHLSDGAIYSTLGVIYRKLGDMAQAEDALRRALYYFRADGDQLMEGGCLHNLGIVYRHLAKLPEAEEYFRQALRIFTPGNSGRSGTLFELSQVLVQQERIAEAYELMEQIKPAQLPDGDRLRYPLIMARCQRQLGHPDQAVETLRTSAAVIRSAAQELQVEAAKEEAFALMELGRVQEAQETINRSMHLMGSGNGGTSD